MAPEAPIRVLLVDDWAVIRDGLKLALAPRCEFEVVAEAGDGLEAIEKAQAHRPDVVVMDINMPRLNGIEATERLKATMPDVPVVILSLHGEAHMRDAAKRAGATDYVRKDADPDELCDAILRVYAESRRQERPSDAPPAEER